MRAGAADASLNLALRQVDSLSEELATLRGVQAETVSENAEVAWMRSKIAELETAVTAAHLGSDILRKQVLESEGKVTALLAEQTAITCSDVAVQTSGHTFSMELDVENGMQVSGAPVYSLGVQTADAAKQHDTF